MTSVIPFERPVDCNISSFLHMTKPSIYSSVFGSAFVICLCTFQITEIALIQKLKVLLPPPPFSFKIGSYSVAQATLKLT